MPEEPQSFKATSEIDDELVVAFVGALGVDLEEAVAQAGTAFDDCGYQPVEVHLTDAFGEFEGWPGALVEEPWDERVWSYMNAGDLLRERWKRHDAVALLAIEYIAARRREQTADATKPAKRLVYLVRSLKRREEVQLLRSVYGSRFAFIAVAASDDTKREFLDTRIRRSRFRPAHPDPTYSVERLMKRDESQELGDWNVDEDGDWGQDVIDTFHRADFFIDLDRAAGEQLKRIVAAFHGDPKISPTRDEFALYQAFGAARRSADLSRQVGAVISVDGNIIAAGTNDVPRAGGGLYWEGDPDDCRDVKLGFDANVKRRHDVAEILVKELTLAKLLTPEATPANVLKVMERGPIGDIIEYVRAVHAEMAALTDAARRGVSVQGATLYCTTFPCHHCARHIVAAGIERVVFVSPYPKSLAEQLHGDSIVVGNKQEDDHRIPFQPFFGVGPRRYIDLFSHEKRRLGDGRLEPFDCRTASARIIDREPSDLPPDPAGSLPPYIIRELRARAAIAEAEEASGFALKRPQLNKDADIAKQDSP